MGPAIVLAPLMPIEGPGRAQDGATAQSNAPIVDGAPDAWGAAPLPLRADPCFVENRGQVGDPDVRFYTQGGAMSVGLMPTGAVFVLRERAAAREGDRATPSPASGGRTASFLLMFDGCLAVEPAGVRPLGHATSFFLGNEPGKWVRGATSYEEVVYEGLYEGVDLRFRFQDGALKYDYVLREGADASRIAQRYVGTLGLSLDPVTQDLIAATPLGAVRDSRPLVLQDGLGDGGGAPGSFRLLGDGLVGFSLPDGCADGRPLVIDPGLVFSTFLGGSGMETVHATVVDSWGNVFVGGPTDSLNFPTTPNAFDTAGHVGTGLMDCFISKYSPAGRLLASTYVGGVAMDYLNALALDPDGWVYAVGVTRSYDFPSTNGALENHLQGAQDAFMLEMDPSLQGFEYGTFIGGRGIEDGYAVDVDSRWSVYVGLVTNSAGYKTTPGAFCATYRGGQVDEDAAIVMKFDASMNVVYCTYVNGLAPFPALEMYQVDTDFDSRGGIYVAGTTASAALNTTPSAALRGYAGGSSDGFVMRLDPGGRGGADLVACTYLGGQGPDYAWSVRAGRSDGRVYVTGETHSKDLPVTSNATQPALSSDSDDTYLAVLDADLTRFVFCTYFGGTRLDIATSVALGPRGGTAALFGATASIDLPTTTGCYDPVKRTTLLSSVNLFVAVFDLSLPALSYSTYLGGSGSDQMAWRAIAFAPDGTICVGAGTPSVDFPTTPGAQDRTYDGGSLDATVTMLDPSPSGPPDPPTNLTVVSGDHRATVRWDPCENVSYRCVRYKAYMGNSSSDLGPAWDVLGSRSEIAFTGLVNGRTYYFGVSVVSSAGEGTKGIVTARPVGRPTQPRNLTASTGDGTISLNWSAPEDDGGGVLGYHVLRGAQGGEIAPVGEVGAAGGNTWRDDDPELVMGAAYLYGVIAWNEAGNGTDNRTTVVPTTRPGAPVGLRAVPGDGNVTLTWSAPKSDGGSPVLGYCVLRGDAEDNMTLLARGAFPAREYLDTGLENARTYIYGAIAYNVNGEGGRSVTVAAIPVGPPGPPLSLAAVPGDGEVALSWARPEVENGRAVTSYNVYVGESIALAVKKASVTGRELKVTGLRNGVEYWFLVAAVNDVGEGPRAAVAATAYGVPTEPNGVVVEEAEAGIVLRWSPPVDAGGAATLTYRVLRGKSPGSLVPMADLEGALEWADTGMQPGATYWYSVQAINSMWEGGATEPVSATFVVRPGQVRSVEAAASGGAVRVTWAAPASDGGAPVLMYIIERDRVSWENDTHLTELDTVDASVLEYVDASVVAGLEYRYSIVAKNRKGPGPASEPVGATVLGPPPAPELSIEVVGDDVRLSWSMPPSGGTMAVTGFVVLSGEQPTALGPLAELGVVGTYTAKGVPKGRAIFYQVVAVSGAVRGAPSNVEQAFIETPEAGEGSGLLLPAAVALVVVVLVVALVVVARRRAREAEGTAGAAVGSAAAPAPVVVDAGVADMAPAPPTPPAAPVAPVAPAAPAVPAPVEVAAAPAASATVAAPATAAVAATAAAVPSAAAARPAPAPTYIVEQAYVIHREGQLVASISREGSSAEDADLMSGMLIAVQGIAQDGLKRQGELESIRYGRNLIAMETGPFLILAAAVHGEPDETFAELMDSTLQTLEASYAGVLDEWTGDPGALAGIEALIRPLIARTEGVRLEDVKGAPVAAAVAVVSAVDFHHGFVRLKAAAVNGTDKVVVDAALEVEYDPDMLRLERIEPPTLRLRGDRAILGTIMPGERKTVAFLFDPQICQGTHIDGFLTYFDDAGVRHRAEMKRRHAEVVCPIFFTREHANTAMLRRLIKEKLHATDLRVFRYPIDVDPHVMFDVGKVAMGRSNISHVSEFEVHGPPYEAEAWYYGETKVKGYQIVARLGVVEDKQALEMFAASTAMEPVTGLLADLRRELQSAIEERRPGAPALDTMRDERLRDELSARPLLLDTAPEDAGGKEGPKGGPA